MRAAIRERTLKMGLEKSVISKELIKEAAVEAARKGESLDLSQIRGNIPQNMPSMLYDPEDEMTQEERIQVDPVSQLSLLKQAENELSNAKWPKFGNALREVVIMFLVVGVTAAIIIFWDKFLRDFYTSNGLIPSSEDIKMRFEGLELPEGWTNMYVLKCMIVEYCCIMFCIMIAANFIDSLLGLHIG